MKYPETRKTTDRRGFLRLLGTTAAGGAVAAVSAGAATGAATGAVAGAEVTPAGKPEALYQETAHVKTYYDLARF